MKCLNGHEMRSMNGRLMCPVCLSENDGAQDTLFNETSSGKGGVDETVGTTGIQRITGKREA